MNCYIQIISYIFVDIFAKSSINHLLWHARSTGKYNQLYNDALGSVIY